MHFPRPETGTAYATLMQKMSIEDYLAQRWQPQYEYHRKKAAQNKRAFQTLRLIEILMAATIPFLNGLDDAMLNESWWDIIVSFQAVSITVLAGLLMLYKFQESWIESRVLVEQLKTERILLETKSGPYDRDDAERRFIERIERLLGGEVRQWSNEHTNESAKGA
jgi:hypothetical protein